MVNKKKSNFKQKSFIFEDYSNAEYYFTKNENKIIKVSLSRTTFLFFFYLILLFIFAIKIFYLSLFPEQKYYSHIINKNFDKQRRDIVDTHGRIIARNINVYKAGIRPKFIKNKDKFLINLRLQFPEINENIVKEKLNKDKFFYLEDRRLTEGEKDKLWSLGLSHKALELKKIQTRIYPQKNLFSHVLGQIDDNNSGISGIEQYFDKDLRSVKINSTPFELTLDSNLQYLIREELNKAQIIFKTKGSAALLMNINNGEILSLISLPDYNLNERVSIHDKKFTNKITKGVYELGSVFKTFTIAAALENKIVTPTTIFKNLEHSLTCGKYTISEHDKLPKNLNTEQILIRSSNIGVVRIAQKIGVKKYKDFLNSLELLDTINFDLAEIGRPLPFNWGKCKLATTSYGHGITTTPLQLAKAYSIISNGGYKIRPTILKKNKGIVKKGKKIISSKTSNQINSMLRKVVNLSEGTANFADVEGYDVGGKTGTALKYNSKAKLNTFVSLFPSSMPKYILLVMLDEPKAAPDFIYNFPPSEKFPNGYKYKGETRNTSGWNTVVVAGKIIEKIGPILAINSLQASKNF